MEDTLLVDSEELLERYSVFRDALIYFNNKDQHYEKLVDAIKCPEAAWYRKESMEFIGKLHPAYINLLRCGGALKDEADEVIKPYDIYEVPENQIKGQVDELDDGTSPFA